MTGILLYSAIGIAGLTALYYGAEFLVKGGVVIARKMHISNLVIGLTLVAFATSAPELVVSTEAACKGVGDIALGNVVGSNICNIALILGCSALVRPLTVHKNLFKCDVPLMLLSTIALSLCVFFTGGLNRITGGTFLILLLAYVTYNIHTARKEELAKAALPPEAPEAEKNETEKEMKLFTAVFFCILGVLLLVGGGKGLVGSAVYFAKLFKVSEAVIGLTIVAVGTSLPELATSMFASYKGEDDIAIGNVVGSNIFNILCIMGITPLIKPFTAAGISLMDISWMIALSIILVPFMFTGWKISRKEGGFLLLSYIAYIALLIR